MTRTWRWGSRRGSIAASLIGCAVLLAAYVLMALGGRASLAAPTGPGLATATTSGTGTVVSTRTTGLGLVVVAGGSKHTVYLFTIDTPGVSHCGTTCQQTWHRVKTVGKPVAAGAIQQTKLGQTTQHQVTYYGHPLYYYVGDTLAGQTRGQGRSSFGGRWWVVGKDGRAGTGALLRMHATPDGSAVAGPLGSGRTVYMLSSDSATHSTCTSSCAAVWPALYTVGKPRAGAGINATLINTFVRSNGQRQVTYNGHPLYYYAGDSSAGQDYGECILQNPGTWYFLDASGHAVKAPCTATPSPTTSTSPPPPAACDTAQSATPTIEVSASNKLHGTTDLGKVLEDGRGCTVYLYTPDTATGLAHANTPIWPPVTTVNAPVAGAGLNCTLGTTPTANPNDGSTEQVTCNNHPLYFYAPDHLTSDALGQGSGNVWFVLDANGNQVGP